MLEKLKENLHILLLLNLALTILGLGLGDNSSEEKIVVLGSDSVNSEGLELKRKICESAFNGWKSGSLSDFLIHPVIIKDIQDGVFSKVDIENSEKLYFKMENREHCKVIIRSKTGFKSIKAIVSTNGPINHRITSLEVIKPKIQDVQEFM